MRHAGKLANHSEIADQLPLATVLGVLPDGVHQGLPARIDPDNRHGELVLRRLRGERTVLGVPPDGVLRGLPARIDHDVRSGELVLRRLPEEHVADAARLRDLDHRPGTNTATAAGSWTCAGGMRGVPCSASLQTARFGDCMPGLITTIAAGSWSCAGCLRGAWKAPPAFKTLAGKGPPSRSCP
jgi:hypothetical protein